MKANEFIAPVMTKSPLDIDSIQSVLKPAVKSDRLEIIVADYVKGS